MPRPSWDNTWLEVARVVAKRSLCERDKVGAVIVSSTQRIVATGYNGPPAGFPHNNLPCQTWCTRRSGDDTDYLNCPALHAESNALSVCDRMVREGGTIYISSDVCYGCAKLVANSGLTRVVVMRHPDRMYRGDESYRLLERCGLWVSEVPWLD